MIVERVGLEVSGHHFVSGKEPILGGFLPETVYAQALDHLVIVCVDCIPLHAGRIMLSKRVRPPHPDWWINGGRMRKGETYREAATRLMQRELGLSLASERFQLVGFYSLVWDERAQPPADNGCHVLSVTHSVELSSRECAVIDLNDEYSGAQWVYPADVALHARRYHPALVQMVHDLDNRPGAGW
jgi:ADP-ribose pyrophosphatase YjhB (NUDIX family)